MLLYRGAFIYERNEIKKKLKTTKRDNNLAISQVDNTVDPLPSQSNPVSVEVNSWLQHATGLSNLSLTLATFDRLQKELGINYI